MQMSPLDHAVAAAQAAGWQVDIVCKRTTQDATWGLYCANVVIPPIIHSGAMRTA
jgi:hypothetical protein